MAKTFTTQQPGQRDLVPPKVILGPASTKATNKVIRTLEKKLPVFFNGAGEGVITSDSRVCALGTVPGIEKPFYLHARNRAGTDDTRKIKYLRIVSGLCLFGKHEIAFTERDNAVRNRGVLTEELASSRRFTDVEKVADDIYVPEAIARLTKVAHSLYKYSETSGLEADWHILLPAPEYKMRAVAAFKTGRLSLPALERYIQIVEERADLITSQIKNSWPSHLKTEPTFTSPLDHIANEISPDLRLDDLRPKGYKMDCWGDVPKQEYDGYVKNYLKHYKDPNSLLVCLENLQETPVFSQAAKTDGFSGIALYPLPRLVHDKSASLHSHTGTTPQQVQEAVQSWR